MRSFFVSRAIALCAAGMLSAVGSLSLAQDDAQPEGRPESRPAEREAGDEATPGREAGARGGQAGARGGQANPQQDQLLATCLLIDNQVEAKLAEFAQKRAESDEVRQFAEKMQQEHTQAAESLMRLAKAGGEAGATRRTGEGADAPAADAAATREREDGAPGRNAPAGATAGGGQQGMFFVTLKKEMGEQCLKSAQEELGKKKGEDFDKCYIRAQVIAHQHMLDGLTVMERHAGQELKQQITQAKETTQQHLEMAKQIAMKFDGESGGDEAGSGAKREKSSTEENRNQ